MRHLSLAAALAAGSLLFATLPGHAADSMSSMTMTAAPTGSPKLQATKTALRGLWQGHVQAVRKVVVAAIAHNAAEEKTAEGEVVANAHQIANAISPYYGQGASDKLFTLLAGHYGAVKAYLEASVAGDKAAQSKATDQITSNASDIATFLSSANPNWSKDALLELFQIHGSHHISQIQELIAHDSRAEAKTWAQMTAHMNTIADALADGIAKQCPAKF